MNHALHQEADGHQSPESFIDREEERATVTQVMTEPHPQHLYLYGAHGTGKTRLVRHALDNVPGSVTTCYLSCIRFDTQYRVLNQLSTTLTGESVSSGYHTTRLQRRLTDALSGSVIIVLDDIDFLLLNEGNDVLYFLSRLDHDQLTVVALSANHSDLRTVIDERTYSTLQPHCLTIEPYPASTRYQILAARARHLFPRGEPFPKSALATIAGATPNLAFAFHWLQAALDAADTTLTDDTVTEVYDDAVRRYRATLLDDFTPHHHRLLTAIRHLVEEQESGTVHSGQIYDQYQELCRESDQEPLTTRRVSDFLKHLELLNIIEADYSYGGEDGKTRRIRLQQF